MAKQKKVGKEKQDKEKKKKESLKESKSSKNTIIVIIMLTLLIAVVVAHFLTEEETFEYNGIEFSVSEQGGVTFYVSKPILVGFVAGGQSPFNIQLRNDPRILEEIPFEGNLVLKKQAIISFSPEIENCEDTYVTLVDFSRVLKAFGIDTSAASSDKEHASENEMPFIDCRDATDQTVILLEAGEETKISKEGDCYTLEINN